MSDSKENQSTNDRDDPNAGHGNAPQNEPDTLPSPEDAATGSDDQQGDPGQTVAPPART
jgi:hypothetical protein